MRSKSRHDIGVSVSKVACAVFLEHTTRGISYILGCWNQTICLEKYIWERHIRDDQCDIDGSKPTEADHIEIIRTIDSYLTIVTDIGRINERYTCHSAINWAKNITVDRYENPLQFLQYFEESKKAKFWLSSYSLYIFYILTVYILW